MTTTKRKFSWTNAGPYICAFFIPVLVMLVVFIERGIWPFGNRCFLCTDLYHQMAPFHKELQWKLTTGGSLLYSWNIGAGTNFWTLSAYYNASPWTFLVGLWPEDYVIEFITWSAVFKIALSSLTMAYYLNKRQGRKGVEGYAGAFIGGFYALCGWMAAYSWVVMWLDCIWLFPLVILGLERLVKENKGLLYAVSLSATIFCNYYIGIIICMGVAVYCFFLLGTERKIFHEFGIKLLKFIFYTCLAVAGAAVILIPYIRYFNMTWSAESTFTWRWYSYFPVIDMLSRMLINVEVHKGLDHWPNIFMGMSVFMLIPLYYLNKKITLREKIGYTIVVLFFWFSFSTRAMDYIWHVFHIPNSLPCRQSFIFVFIMLTMSYRGLVGLKDRTYREIGIVMLLALGFVFLAEKLETNTEVFTNYVFYVSALFIIVYAIVFYGIRRGRIYKDILIIILIAVCIIENVVNTSVTSVPTVGRNDYIEYDDGINAAMDLIREKEGPDSFYRAEKAQLRTKNDGAWLHFPSISTFSSVANVHLTDFYTTIGLESSANAYGSYGQTFLTNMLMSVKYTIAQRKLPDSDLYSLTYTNGTNVWVYENKYTLPVGYVFSDPNVIYSWLDTSSTPLENQNALVRNLLGYETLFVDVTPRYTGSTTINLTVQEDGFYYAYATTTGPKSIRVSNPETGLNRNFTSLNRSFTMELGWCRAGDILTFSNTEENSTKNIAVTLYRMDEEVLKDFYDKANQAPFVVEHFEDTKITGYVEVPQGGGLLFTTIAAEEGWEVFVDGQKVDYQTLKKTYIGHFLNAGRHEIEFRYHVPMLLPSAIISIVAWLIMLLIGLLPFLKKAADKRRIKRAAAAAGVPAIVETDALENVWASNELSGAEGTQDVSVEGETTPKENPEAEDAPIEEASAGTEPAEEPSAEDATAEALSAEEALAEEPSAEDVPAEEPSVEDVPAEVPSEEDASAEEGTLEEEQTAGNTPAEASSEEQSPAVGAPAPPAPSLETSPEDDLKENAPEPEPVVPEKAEVEIVPFTEADSDNAPMEEFEEAFQDANEQREAFFWETAGKNPSVRDGSLGPVPEESTSTVQLEEEKDPSQP
jgi:uncharacterized membrane protein YfhO